MRTLEDDQKMISIRAAIFMAEQSRPYAEAFDGNDQCASHRLVFHRASAVGTLRMRWFACFTKRGQVGLQRRQRGRPALQVLLAEAFEEAARKRLQADDRTDPVANLASLIASLPIQVGRGPSAILVFGFR